MNNYQALGYLLLACKEAGYTRKEARELYENMEALFDIKTENEAFKEGHEWLEKEGTM